MLSGSFFPNFGQGPFPKIAGKSPESIRIAFETDFNQLVKEKNFDFYPV